MIDSAAWLDATRRRAANLDDMPTDVIPAPEEWPATWTAGVAAADGADIDVEAAPTVEVEPEHDAVSDIEVGHETEAAATGGETNSVTDVLHDHAEAIETPDEGEPPGFLVASTPVSAPDVEVVLEGGDVHDHADDMQTPAENAPSRTAGTVGAASQPASEPPGLLGASAPVAVAVISLALVGGAAYLAFRRRKRRRRGY